MWVERHVANIRIVCVYNIYLNWRNGSSFVKPGWEFVRCKRSRWNWAGVRSFVISLLLFIFLPKKNHYYDTVLPVTCSKRSPRFGKTRVQCFGFASHWLKRWWQILKPITEHGNRNRVIGHFRVHLNLHFKARLSAKSLLWKSVLFILKLELITITKISHLDSLWKRDWGELGNGLLLSTVIWILLCHLLAIDIAH